MSKFLIPTILSWIGFCQILSAELLITEFLADNDSITVPGASSQLVTDWIEIHNPSPTTINLAGWHLTDDPDQLERWPFPIGTTLAPGEFLVLFADDGISPDAQGFLHTNFRLGAGGDFLALTRPDGSIASSFAANGSDYPSQSADISFGIPTGGGIPVFFDPPTPGAANSAIGTAFITAPEFSLNHGIYTAPISLTITSETAGATIYVTTDSEPPVSATGTPTTTANVYNGPLTLTTTSVVRAAVVVPGSGNSAITTRTFVFPDSVASQERPPNYPTSWGAEPQADYEVDPRISQSTIYADRFREGLRDIPTISVAGRLDDIFGPNGIYSRTLERGVEVPVSAEYFEPETADGANLDEGFQLDCGFRIQGGGSRTPDRTIKHSLSLRFRAALGSGRLDFPIFDDISNGQAEESFNNLHLRSIFQNSWTHANSAQQERATYIQDQWMRDSFIAMGHRDGGYGKFVNVYINGLYWGIYNLHERLDDDHYADYNGFDSDEVTGYNPRNRNGPEFNDFSTLRNTVLTGTWEEITNIFDVDAYIDHVLLNQYADNDDLRPNSNYRLAGGGSANAIWRIYPWDLERTLEDENDTELAIIDDGVDFLDFLERFPQFRRRFADRAYKHLFNDGVLSNARNRARFMRYVDIIDIAIVGESARWGDDRRATPYNRDQNWQTAVFGRQSVTPTRGVLGAFFPTRGRNRTTTIDSAWRARTWENTPSETWLPSNDPPSFSLAAGSTVSPGNALTLIGSTGTILFTTDGSDPAENGIIYNGGPLPLSASGIVKTRSLEGSQFSALNEAFFLIEEAAGPTNLVISEIHYNPQGPNDSAFLELHNTSSQAINLLGTTFTDGITYTFTEPQTLAAGARLVLAENESAFIARYGTPPADTYTGALSTGGERIALNTAAGDLIAEVEYDNSLPWPERADGDGSSLVFTGLSVYRASTQVDGTPGTAPVAAPGVVINEVLAHSDAPLSDTIELHNPTNSAIDLSGWFLSDNTDRYESFRIPDGTSIAAGGFLIFEESDFNNPEANTIVSYSGNLAEAPTIVTISGTPPATGSFLTISGYQGIGDYNGTHEITVTGANSFTIPVPFQDNGTPRGTWTPGAAFAFSSTMRETITLTTAEAALFSDSVTIGGSFSGESFARYPNIQESILVPASMRTFGAANTSTPIIGPIVISEIFYDGANTFVEIHNSSNTVQTLANWTLRGTADFDFAAGDSLAPGETAIIVADLVNFQGLPASTQVFGPWEDGDTLLGTSGGVVRLQRPDTSEPAQGSPATFPQVVEDEVVFLTAFPWPAAPGQALRRADPETPGSDPAAWRNAAPTPGIFSTNTFANFITANNLTGSITADADGDGIPDLGEFALGLNPNRHDPQILRVITPGIPPTFTIDPSAVGVTTQLEASLDLITWETDPNSISPRLFYRLSFTE